VIWEGLGKPIVLTVYSPDGDVRYPGWDYPAGSRQHLPRWQPGPPIGRRAAAKALESWHQYAFARPSIDLQRPVSASPTVENSLGFFFLRRPGASISNNPRSGAGSRSHATPNSDI
jgi:hypothetical protein